jgi:amyloid beta precursor protein binding protein 1
MEETHLVLLSTISGAYSIPLIVMRSYGFIGLCRIQTLHHEIVESRPENEVPDLRILNAFPTLSAYCTQYNLMDKSMDTLLHGHIPYVVILYQSLQIWRQQVRY